MEGNKYVEVFPNKIVLQKSYDQTYLESKIVLTNLLDKYVVFKVYINKSAIYSANPSTSFIRPKENISINIKRLEKYDPNQQENVKDKFLILAFPVNQVISDNNEAKAVIKSTNLKSDTNQEIYLEAEIDQTLTERSSIITEPTRVRASSNFQSINPTTDETSQMQPSNAEIEELKKQIEEVKKEIKNYEIENSKLSVQQTNYANNATLYRNKVKVLTDKGESKGLANNQFPLSFVILLATLGLTLGSYINRLISNN